MTTPLTLGHHADTGQAITWGGDVPETIIQVDGERHAGRTRLARALAAEAMAGGMRTILITSEARARPGALVVDGPVDLPGLLAAAPGTRETLVVTDGIDIDAAPTPGVRLLAISHPVTLTGMLSPTIHTAAHMVISTAQAARVLARRGVHPTDVDRADDVLLWLEPARPDMTDLAVLVTGGVASPICCPAYAPMEEAA